MRAGVVAAVLASGTLDAFQQQPAEPKLGAITPQSLQGHVSFLASDALEGRGTPSRGLDIAAEYIAAQFRRAGLEPINREGYFQWANWPLGSNRPIARVRNVAGLLRGSDPQLRDTYVVVSAHYDHLGFRAQASGDNIFNGANDNASGTASVLELASAFASGTRPRRSILFVLFFGEELGLLGSKYYCENPIAPLQRTVANINLEQLGRYDSREGLHPASLNVTGFDYSDVAPLFRDLGAPQGIEVYRDGDNSDSFFARSDNQSFANHGVPAHTFSAALEYGDYHLVSDHWQKLDYVNMAALVKLVGAGVMKIANAAQPPRWNAENPKAKKYASLRPGR